mmetsp:Transcript_25642/g.22424  ORF Transcript_25642/g.22424 Transcript_25642/m.22424 type:complete len:92 (+) Transcript_25642:38-313(+)
MNYPAMFGCGDMTGMNNMKLASQQLPSLTSIMIESIRNKWHKMKDKRREKEHKQKEERKQKKNKERRQKENKTPMKIPLLSNNPINFNKIV